MADYTRFLEPSTAGKLEILRRGIAGAAMYQVDFRSKDDVYLKLHRAANQAGLDGSAIFRDLVALIAPDGNVGFMTGFKP